jgi:MATE family multidrug resistance protein
MFASTRPTIGAHVRATLTLGLPLIGSHLAQMSLHVTDTVMLGWYSTEALAACVIGASSFFIVFVLGSGFAQAVMPLVANAVGAGDETQLRRDTRMGLWLSIGFGALTYPLFWNAEAIFLAAGQPPEVAALAQDYLRIAGLGMIPALLVMALKSYLAALGRTQVVLWATVAAVVLNVAANWFLIFGNGGAPELGVRGAAIASVLAQGLTLLVLGLYAGLLPELRRYRLFHRFWRADAAALVRVFRLGWPIGLTGLAEGGMFQAATLMMGWIGTVEIAAHGIAMQMAALSFMVHLGLSNAATVRTGTFDGAGQAQALRDGARVAIAMSAGFGMAMVALFLWQPQALIAAFIDMSRPDSGTILAIGVTLLAFAAMFQMADAMQVMALGLLRGIRDTRVPLILASVSYWLIGIPASYLLAFRFGMGAGGLWLGLVIGLTVAAVLLMARFWRLAPRAEAEGAALAA